MESEGAKPLYEIDSVLYHNHVKELKRKGLWCARSKTGCGSRLFILRVLRPAALGDDAAEKAVPAAAAAAKQTDDSDDDGDEIVANTNRQGYGDEESDSDADADEQDGADSDSSDKKRA